MAVAFGNILFPIRPVHLGTRTNMAGIGSQPQGTALGNMLVLIRQEVNDLVGRRRIKLTGVGIREPCHIPCKGNDCYLHTQTDPKIRHIMLPAVVCGDDLPFNTPIAKAAGYNDAGAVGKNLPYRLVGDRFGIDPLDVHVGTQRIACVAKCLRNRQIRVMQLDIFTHQTNGHAAGTVLDSVQHLVPLPQINLRCINAQLPAYNLGEVAFFQHDRRFVQHRQGNILNHAVRLNIAEHGDFFENGFFQRLITAQNNDVGIHAHALKLLYRVLGGF